MSTKTAAPIGTPPRKRSSAEPSGICPGIEQSLIYNRAMHTLSVSVVTYQPERPAIESTLASLAAAIAAARERGAISATRRFLVDNDRDPGIFCGDAARKGWRHI